MSMRFNTRSNNKNYQTDEKTDLSQSKLIVMSDKKCVIKNLKLKIFNSSGDFLNFYFTLALELKLELILRPSPQRIPDHIAAEDQIHYQC